MGRASRSKRSFRLGLDTKWPDSTLMATSRPSRVSRARYTSPMPPAPTCATTSYGPSLAPMAITSGADGAGLRRSEGRLNVRLVQVPDDENGDRGSYKPAAHKKGIEV